MTLIRPFFPARERDFKGKRWVKIILRTLHLIGAVCTGIYLAPLQSDTKIPFVEIIVISGAMLIILEIWSNGIWLIQARGISIILKVSILSLFLYTDYHKMTILFAVVIISGIISHAPGGVRYYSFFHGKRVDFLEI